MAIPEAPPPAVQPPPPPPPSAGWQKPQPDWTAFPAGGEARILVEHDFFRGGVAIYCAVRTGDGWLHVLQNDGVIQSCAPAEQPVEPTLRLRDDMARALLDALARHYNGASDVQALRRDYEGERARVDRLIGMMGGQAT